MALVRELLGRVTPRLRALPLEVLLPAALGGALLAFSVFADLVRGTALIPTVMSAVVCAATALSGWRFRPAAIVTVVLLVAAVPLPADEVGLATNACVVLFLAAGLKAKRRDALLLAAALLFPLLVRPTLLHDLSVAQIVLTAFTWLTLFALAGGLGWTVHSLQRLAEYRAAEAVAAVRRQWAIELHDTLKHDLARMRMVTQSLLATGDANEKIGILDEQVRTAGTHLSGLLDVLAGHADVGGIASTGRADLASSLRDETHRLQRTGFTVHASLDEAPIHPGASQVLTRIGREATNNIVLHGNPDEPVTILFEVEPDVARLVLINTVLAADGHIPGLGLASMRTQVEELGGTFRGEERDGCWVTDVTVPLRAA